MQAERAQLPQTATPDVIRDQMLAAVEQLMQRLQYRESVLAELQDLRRLLEALPMPTVEFGTASNRLRNAQRYAQLENHGAARFELQMLVGGLRDHQSAGSRDYRNRWRLS
jgi:hypothetical protein